MTQNAQQIARLVQRLLRLTRGRLSVGWVVALVALLVGYLVAQPHLERTLGIQLPGLDNQGVASDAESPPAAQLPTTQLPTNQPRADSAPGETQDATVLRSLGNEVLESPAGLRYRRGSRHGHRLQHVMAHARDDPDRPGQHGVFTANEPDAIVQLIDEAYQQAETGARTRTKREAERVVHTVDLGRRIGYIGGESGNRRGRPPATHLRLVLQGQNVITAFPVRP